MQDYSQLDNMKLLQSNLCSDYKQHPMNQMLSSYSSLPIAIVELTFDNGNGVSVKP